MAKMVNWIRTKRFIAVVPSYPQPES
jgi:hypothetical protein